MVSDTPSKFNSSRSEKLNFIERTVFKVCKKIVFSFSLGGIVRVFKIPYHKLLCATGTKFHGNCSSTYLHPHALMLTHVIMCRDKLTQSL